MRATPIAGVCLLASVALFGQSASSSIEGQVVNAVTGEPVKRASVTLSVKRVAKAGGSPPMQSSASRAVETDLDGRFVFPDLVAGGYGFSVNRQGFVDLETAGDRQSSLLLVGENHQLTGLTVRLTPHSVIYGKVLDAEGEPVAQAPVSAGQLRYLSGQPQFSVASAASITNDLGEFRVAGLAAGRYFLVASPPRRSGMPAPDSTLPAKPGRAHVRTYYPNAVDLRSATSVRIGASSQVGGIDIRLAQTPIVAVRGRLIEPGAPPDSPHYMRLVQRGPSLEVVELSPSAIERGGVFLFSGVRPGSYTLLAERRSLREWRLEARASVNLEVADQNLDGIELELVPTFDITGRAVSERPGECTSGISFLDESGHPVLWTPIGPSGAFTLKGVFPATYRLLPASGRCAIQSVLVGGRESPAGAVTIDGSGPLEIRMKASDAVVDGAVVDSSGAAVQSPVITFVPRDGKPWLDAQAPKRANSDGTFRVLGLSPGVYGVTAWHNVALAALRSPEFVKKFEDRAQVITVGTSGRQTLRLTAISGTPIAEPVPPPAFDKRPGSLDLQVVNSVTGGPLAGVVLTLGTQPACRPQFVVPLRLPAGAQSAPTVEGETDVQGRFSFANLQPEMYCLSVEPPRGTGTSWGRGIAERIVVGDGQHVIQTLRLVPPGVIAGRITGEFGETVANLRAAVYRLDGVRIWQRIVEVAEAPTGNLGEFRISGLPPGSYYLRVALGPSSSQGGPVLRPQTGETEMGYGSLWYPNAPDLAGASPVDVGPGAEVPVEMVLKRTRLMRLRGSVVDPAGQAPPHWTVGLSPHGLSQQSTAGRLRREPGGTFEISGVPPGSYLLWASAPGVSSPGKGMSSRLAFLPIEIRDGDLDGLELRVSPGATVRGVVKWEGSGIRPGQVAAFPAWMNVPMMAVVSPSDGSFALRDVWPLPHKLELPDLCPTCRVKSMRYGGQDIPAEGVVLDGSGELEIVVSATQSP